MLLKQLIMLSAKGAAVSRYSLSHSSTTHRASNSSSPRELHLLVCECAQ